MMKKTHHLCFIGSYIRLWGNCTKNKTVQRMNFSIKEFFSKCDQICRKLKISSHLLKNSLMENFIFLQRENVRIIFEICLRCHDNFLVCKFCRNSAEMCLFTKFPHKQITRNFSILRSVSIPQKSIFENCQITS